MRRRRPGDRLRPGGCVELGHPVGGHVEHGAHQERGQRGVRGGDALTTTADIEVGGGAIFADEEVVVTQPSAGEFKCFTAICTHQGCVVSSVSDGTINCECHGSRFSIENGDVEAGPATFALEEIQINVAGDEISLA